MDLGIVLSAAETLYAALHSRELREICSLFGYKSQVDDLQRSVSTIKAVLRDAESVEEPSHEVRHWIEELKHIVYDADDIFDEFLTLAEMKQVTKGAFKGCQFFNCQISLYRAFTTSRKVSEIRKKMDAIAMDHGRFGFICAYPSIKRSRETCSYVYDKDVIGRENDVEYIVSLLMDSNNQQDVSFLTIVGIGGLGKTTLAQMVYNDERVKSAFPLRLWACVSDHDQEQFDVKRILHMILASATGQAHEVSTMEFLQCQLREKLIKSRYLLVLDDIWTENRYQWLQLENFLLGSHSGSWILVTTRSKGTAGIVGDSSMYELQGLSVENSWRLFAKTAFGLKESTLPSDMVEIGQAIIKRCANNPLAIKVAGSLLYGQDKSKWASFLEVGLYNLKDNIIPILKFSYLQLEFPLKSCFTYCALFPKDTEIKKEMLISHWMAHDYIVPLDEGQRIEDAAEEYISILMQRCFFQDIEIDEYGEIFSFKIHDLMHDIAIEVARKEIFVTNSVSNNMDTKIRHLSIMRTESTQYNFCESHVRSFLGHGFCFTAGEMDQSSLKSLFAKWRRLRVLDLSFLGIKKLPDSIDKLLHLRFLDLSHNYDLKVLPVSVMKLHNLQSLNLSCCGELKELPKDLWKLVKLRILDITGAGITCMPRGLGKLSCLRTLTMFVVKERHLSWKQWIDQLEELKHLRNLKGRLHIIIRFPENVTNVKEGAREEGAYLKTKEHLNDISITLTEKWDKKVANWLLEELRPHPNLKGFHFFGSWGVKMPHWGEGNKLVTFLPNLIRLVLSHIDIEHLTCLGNLPHLKELSLDRLETLDSIIECRAASASISEAATSSLIEEQLSYFPSLDELNLSDLPNLKNWSLMSEDEYNDQLFRDTSKLLGNFTQLMLPQLRKLSIRICPNLRAILFCPILEEISLVNFNEGLQIKTPNEESVDETIEATSSTSCSSSSSCAIPKLQRVETDSAAWFNSLPDEAFRSLKYLSIRSDEKMASLGEIGKMFRSCSSTLLFLQIEKCSKLENVLPEGFEHLTALKDLWISECPKLRLSKDEGQKVVTDMVKTSYSLQTLQLEYLPLLIDLPDWMQCFTTLKTLRIRACERLEYLPDWMPKLISLKRLHIWGCSARLKQRCQENGEDWPHIQYIPDISLKF